MPLPGLAGTIRVRWADEGPRIPHPQGPAMRVPAGVGSMAALAGGEVGGHSKRLGGHGSCAWREPPLLAQWRV